MPKGKVTFNTELCKGCELCTTVCPMKIVIMDFAKMNSKGYHVATVNEMEKCIACGNCAKICPDSVITVERID